MVVERGIYTFPAPCTLCASPVLWLVFMCHSIGCKCIILPSSLPLKTNSVSVMSPCKVIKMCLITTHTWCTTCSFFLHNFRWKRCFSKSTQLAQGMPCVVYRNTVVVLHTYSRTDSVWFTVDGEPFEAIPICVSVLPHKLNIFI